FEVEVLIARNDREADAVLVAARDECLEHLRRREADLRRHALRGEIIRIDFVLADLVRDAEGIEQARGVGLHRARSLGACAAKRNIRRVAPPEVTDRAITRRLPQGGATSAAARGR